MYSIYTQIPISIHDSRFSIAEGELKNQMADVIGQMSWPDFEARLVTGIRVSPGNYLDRFSALPYMPD